ncbi:MAG: diguanylate cyclase [Acidobacteriota bacterium]
MVKYNGAEFITYTVSDGLINNTVRAILKDNEILWVGTNNGLSQFNGKTFRNYTFNDGLGKGTIWCISRFQGYLWFGTSEGGLSRFDGKRFITYTTQDGLPNNYIYSLLSDDKYLWIGTSGGGLSRFDGKNFMNYGEKEGFYGKTVRALLKQGSILWVGTRDRGLFKFENNEFINYFPEDDIYCAALGKDLWFGTIGDGIIRHKDNFKRYDIQNGLIANNIYSILIDKENSVWLTTNNGISKILSDKFLNYLENKIVMSIYDYKNAIWFGTYQDGLIKFDTDFITYTTKNGLSSNQIWDLAEFKDKLYIATFEGLNSFDGKRFEKYTQKDGLISNAVVDILSTENFLWLATAQGISKFDGKKFINYTTKNGLVNNYVRYIYQDGNKIWFATEGGASCFDGKKFKNYTTNEGLSNNRVNTIFRDRKGILWLGTNLGINKFDGKNFTIYTTKNGLSDNNIVSVIEYDGNLWLGTDKGLNIFDGEKVIKVYNQKKGLVGDETCTPNSLYLDIQRNIWFGITKGVIKYIPQNDIPNKVPPPVYIEKFLVNNSPIEQSENLKFKYNQNNIDFFYIGLSFKDEQDVRYQYRLEGYDKDWSKITEKREIRYTNLNNGHYTFKITARNGDGYWSKTPAQLYFTILPPFWETWWFIGVSIIGLLVLVVAGYRYRVNKIKREKKILEEIIRERTRELEEKSKLLNELAITDELTKIYNRRFFMETLNQEIRKMIRRKHPDSLALIILDIDHFKRFNDKYGHRTGDYILTSMVKILKNRIRSNDTLARYGGEEFSVILPSTDLKGAQTLAEDLRQSVKNTSFQFDDQLFKITISLGIGIVRSPRFFHERLIDNLIKAADDALYEAKNSGRNQVCFREIIYEEIEI